MRFEVEDSKNLGGFTKFISGIFALHPHGKLQEKRILRDSGECK